MPVLSTSTSPAVGALAGLDRTGASTRRRALITIALGEFVDGYDLIVIGGVLLALAPQWQLSTAQIGLLSAITFFGSAVGAVVFGDLADRIGRRRIFVLNLVAFVGLTVLSAFVPGFALLLVFRFLIGVAIGADISASMSFLAELAPKDTRGGWMGAFPQIAWTTGALVSVLTDAMLLAWGGEHAWRWMLALGALPAVGVLLLRRTLPDSPRWLLSQGRTDEARAAFVELGIDGDLEVAPARPPRGRQTVRAFAEIFRAPWTGAAVFAIVVTGVSAYPPGASSVLGPYVFQQIGNLSTVQSELAGAVIWIGGIVGATTAFFVLDRITRFAGLAISFLGIFAVYVLMLFAIGSAWLIPLYCAQGIFTWFGAAVTWIVAGELLPTRLRARALGLAHGLSRTNLGIAALAVPPLLHSWGFRPLVLVLGSIGVALVGFSYLFRRYDTTGRSVDDTSLDVELTRPVPVQPERINA